MKVTDYKIHLLIILLFLGLFTKAQVFLTSSELRITISEKGQVTSLLDRIHQKECLAPGQTAPLLRISCNGQLEEPATMTVDHEHGILNLYYPVHKVNLGVAWTEKGTHISFEITDVKPAAIVDLVIWGPYPVNITKVTGEIIGLCRDDEYALGLQVLNVKTLGGYPVNDEGSDQGRGRMAEKKENYSVLQAYSMDRSRSRKVTAYGGNYPNMPVIPIPGETVSGSKIALFGCPAGTALDRIGEIELSENLPHPMLNDMWTKTSIDAGRSYLIADYTESSVDELLEFLQRSGMRTLYSMSPFKSWGHYEINPESFPHGVKGMKECVEKAHKQGLRLGAHTLTNFINTNDAYVTPIPDPRLAKTGYSHLTGNIDAKATEIGVASPEYFNNEKANWLHTIQIGSELIRYRTVTAQAPYNLMDCERGAWGTSKASHEKGSEVAKLMDYPYKTFFPNFDLQNEIAKNLALRFNETGLSQMDFDGHEGCQASGQGDYAIAMFAKTFYDNLDHTVINGTSNSMPYYWHINTYCNWGEPWYEGFRESMQEYRIKNQALFERNYLPNMLGWYLLTATTSLSDIEWMLARAAAYNAGFALATDLESLRKNPQTGEILDAIRYWEALRMGNFKIEKGGGFEITNRLSNFTPEQKEKFRNPANEFHLVKVGEQEYDLYPLVKSSDYSCAAAERQAGEPSLVEWQWENPGQGQMLQFLLKVKGDSGTITNPSFELDHYRTLIYPVVLQHGESLLCEGTQTARVYDAKGRQIKTVEASFEIPVISTGKHTIGFNCKFAGVPAPLVTVNFRILGTPERVVK